MKRATDLGKKFSIIMKMDERAKRDKQFFKKMDVNHVATKKMIQQTNRKMDQLCSKKSLESRGIRHIKYKIVLGMF